MSLPLSRIGVAKVVSRGGEHQIWCVGDRHYVEQFDWPGVVKPDGKCWCADEKAPPQAQVPA